MSNRTLDIAALAAGAPPPLDMDAAEVIQKLAQMVVARNEDIDLLRARAPRAYILTRKSEWLRMFREAASYLHVCRRQHHGTDWDGRRHLIAALEVALKELGESEDEQYRRQIAELRLDESAARAAKAEGAG